MGVVSFTSNPKPPADIVSFTIQRSDRAATGTVALVGDVDTTTNIITVAFDVAPSVGELAGDYFIADDTAYTIETNTTTTVTIDDSFDLTPITLLTFPLSIVVIDDMAEFGDFTTLATYTPPTTWVDSYIHQYTDSTGTSFDWYKTIAINTGGVNGTTSDPFLSSSIVLVEQPPDRLTPKDRLSGVVGGTVTFEVTYINAGAPTDPIDSVVTAVVLQPPSITGSLITLDTVTLTRINTGLYRGTWTIPSGTAASPEYIVSYRANVSGTPGDAITSYVEFASEFFEIDITASTIYGRFAAYATLGNLRDTFWNIDNYLPDAESTDQAERDRILQFHLEEASKVLEEHLNLAQVRANSADRRHFVCAFAIWTILMGSTGQDGSAVSEAVLARWERRYMKVLDQLNREGDFQGISFGRG